MKVNLGKYIPFAILSITIPSLTDFTSLPINTYLWWCVDATILIAFIKSRRIYYDRHNDKNAKEVFLYLGWNAICILRGTIVADNYWEWKNLIGTGMVLLLPLSVYISTNITLTQNILSTWLKYALPAFFLFLPFFTLGDAMGRYLAPLTLVVIFLPILNNKWKIIILLFTILVVFGDPEARSNIIKFAVSFLFGILFYFQKIIPKRLFELGRLLLLTIPIILFFLGVTGRFNIFKMDEYLGGEKKTTYVENGEVKEAELTADTRSFLYEEVISSAFKYDYVWLGRTPARGNESPTFGDEQLYVLKTGKMERFANEVSILNVFTWTGIVGVILYFSIFYKASYLAINRSNNKFMQIIGLYVAFRWTYGWVEDFTNFDLYYLFLWIMIGMCLSRSFRKMSDIEIKNWILGIFDKKYRQINSTSQPPESTNSKKINVPTSFSMS